MGAVTISEMLAAEANAISHGWTEERLMNLAGERLGTAIARFLPRPGTVVGYLGKGHNAGDTLVALKILRDRFNWKIAVRNAFPIAELAPLTQKTWLALNHPAPLDHPPSPADLNHPLLLLDGLLGSGGHGPLRGPLVALALEMQTLRQHAGACVAAIDLPSGIHPDTGESPLGSVIADITLMIGNAKIGLLSGHAASSTGALAVVPVEPLTFCGEARLTAITPHSLSVGKPPRPYDFHKGMAGRVAVLAGSANFTGAAILAASGALRGGAGLITLFVPHPLLPAITCRCPPEIIVRGFDNPLELLDQNFDSWVIGCGLGTLSRSSEDGLLELVSRSTIPTVVDADALNSIARRGKTEIFKANHLLTPHPGEFARIAPEQSKLPREEAVQKFVDGFPSTLLLKGCRTLVSSHGQPVWCNTTGTPGMATGGQGDLLAGVIGARLAAGDSPLEAGCLSAWLCGRGAEISVSHSNQSEESITPSDVLNHLGAAYQDWKTGSR